MRQWAALGLLALASGCGGGPPQDDEGRIIGFAGIVAGDEPRAVLIARSVLTAGGTAGDAAAAYYFAATVTLPSRASLGGGGVCVVHEPATQKTEFLEFLPRAAAPAASPGEVAVAVPGAARGMFALHARYGRQRWELLVFEAERIARFGTEVSRAFARDLAAGGAELVRDPAARRIFAGAGGAPLGEGERLRQLDLAATLGRLRIEGPGAFYSGPGAQAFVAGARAIGGALVAEDLRTYLPSWRATAKAEFGNHVAHFAGTPAAGGMRAAELWAALGAGGRWDRARAEDRAHLLLETAAQLAAATASQPAPLDRRGLIDEVWADRVMRGVGPRHAPSLRQDGAPPASAASTGFAVMDREGGAVACAVTAGRLFGTGRVVPGTGIVAADPVTAEAAASLAPVLVVNVNSKDAFLAAAGAGDPAAASALAQVLLDTAEAERKLADAVAAPRAHYVAALDAAIAEQGADALAQRGHKVALARALARVNAIWCPSGIRRASADCVMATDPRGFGLAVGVEE